ncbi:BadF/BadG/BcrA/BcrD ATPase family protein [Pontibacter sp. SGAir0037]|uniref:BadF/BadG/BcrA/BcrD ATPase family protein n=1 Tax=Pontibacter sp. SGAir0037 TaxID=2571030 RepID=UPI0010CD4B8E|nr:BadF/BadG/BcrA/BcrD ATPase family protein [Pontibacter sp. SGAir0037]QCR24330.1 hypothetical protein C1N53_19510 [Pontibacter sp. SGAir0037]
MILLADSGATKTDWRVIDIDRELEQITTLGFNPMYQESEEIYQVLHESLLPNLLNKAPSEIHYYGAGCSTPDRNKRVADALSRLFPEASIYIEHDLLAAARAACGQEAGIACIAGTGSNTCLYDGTDVIDNIPSLGFLLGDEGSGAYMGKLLIRAYLYRELPDELAKSLKNRFNLTKDIVLNEVYSAQVPSRYMATFAKFMHEKRKNPVIHAMIYESFALLFERHISKYDGYPTLPVNFVGSVAYHFSDELKQVAKKYGAKIGKIISSPSEGLIQYHQDLLKQKA